MNEQNHFDFGCDHQWKPTYYCDVCGIWIDPKDVESNNCPNCDSISNWLHDCMYCGEKIEHSKYLETIN